MMFGNVAPAPLSFTCARRGAASARAAARAMRGDFGIRVSSSELERELSLEQRLGAGRFLRRGGRPLVAQVIPVTKQPPVGRQLIGDAADEARLFVGGTSGLRVENVHSSDHGGLGTCELVDAEGAVEVAVGRGSQTVLGRRGLPGEGELLG